MPTVIKYSDVNSDNDKASFRALYFKHCRIIEGFVSEGVASKRGQVLTRGQHTNKQMSDGEIRVYAWL